MATAGDSRRRFVPVAIETTFEQHRRATGPAGELTPSPSVSPTSPSPQKEVRVKRRFAPQLVESSIRRSRRAGDVGPATRPTDRTDITPYTKHIYAPKSKKRHGASKEPASATAYVSDWESIPSWRVGGRKKGEKRVSAGRRESCDDEIADGVFDTEAKYAQRRMPKPMTDEQRRLQEIAMAAFPNSELRIGGAEHFFVNEGSGSEEEEGTPANRGRSVSRKPRFREPSRRDSSEENVGWAVKEMQEHHEMLAKRRTDTRIDSIDLDKIDLDSPPGDALWTTQTRTSLAGSLSASERQLTRITSQDRLQSIGESPTSYRPESPVFIDTYEMPYIPSAPEGQAGTMGYNPSSRFPAETGFGGGHGGGYGGGFSSRPFGRFGHDRDSDAPGAARSRNVSPPLLGKELTFRMMLSPQQTKLEPDHAWDLETGTTATDNRNRDASENHGLWHGYCWTEEKQDVIAKVSRPAMIHTPYPEPSSGDPFAAAFNGANGGANISEEPSSIDSRSGLTSARALSTSEHRSRNGQVKGMHMLQGLDERLRKEKAAADLEDRIAAQFDDAFVTQVYNYLSLGYPSTARAYDDELSKISNIPVEDLERDDENKMGLLAGGKAKGYILTEEEKNAMRKASGEAAEEDGKLDNAHKNAASVKADGAEAPLGTSSSGGSSGESTEEMTDEEKGPRWIALKKYVREWARQHPDLDSNSPPIWGMRERRGSWGL